MPEELYGAPSGFNLTAAQTVQTQNCVDITLAGNSTSAGAGYALISSGTLTLAGGTNITLSQNGNHVTISAFTEAQSFGMSNLGNTDGTSGMASGSNMRFVIVGGSNVTLSQSLDAAKSSGTITINAFTEALPLRQWTPPGIGSLVTTQIGQSTLKMFPAQLEMNGSFSHVDIFGSIGMTTNALSSFSGTVSMYLGIYTRNNSTLSLASSGSQSFPWNNVAGGSTNNFLGVRHFGIPINAVMTPGEYNFGFMSATASAGANGMSISNLALQTAVNAFAGEFGSTVAASEQMLGGLGYLSVQTAALPAAVGFSDLVGTGAGLARPVINFMNWTA